MTQELKSVVYHNVGAASDFERGLGVTTSRAMFRRQIAHFRANYNIIDIDTLLSGKLPDRALLITFDDFYRSALDAIDEELRPHGIPSVFFVNPGLLGNKNVLIDCVVAGCVNRFGIERVCADAGLPPAADLASLISGHIFRLTSQQQADLKAQLTAKFGLSDCAGRSPAMNVEDLPRLASMRVEIGNHTASHVVCRNMHPSELQSELVDAQKALQAMSGTTVRTFSAPYGYLDDLTPEVLGVLRGSGHLACFVVHGRSNRYRPADDIWYRQNVMNRSPLRCYLSMNVMPIIKSLKYALRRTRPQPASVSRSPITLNDQTKRDQQISV